MINFILILCVVFATIALVAIAVELSNTRTAIEVLGEEIDELIMNVREQNEPKRFNEPRN